MTERMIDEKDLGYYAVKAGRVSAKLQLTAQVIRLSPSDSGEDIYQVYVHFEKTGRYIGSEEGNTVAVKYATRTIPEIFEKLKKAEEGIETLLAENPEDDHLEIGEVVRCINQLREDTSYIEADRKVAKKARIAHRDE